ncbi:hypothetical protein F2P56_029043 [Juglans regia]|uniref:non-specific serine/threonine protein kinase n=2 Tax=Juglans regia TaxID=51240 RepID=A0A2I4GE48_JUGRE|nr:L-type lectin-domain containing receptor kinase IX.1-like [Juglans regia]KAF5448517.1 hypothetical protein F2P56_029043 [Juglans regia]
MAFHPPKLLRPYMFITIFLLFIIPCATQLFFNYSDFNQAINRTIRLAGNATLSGSAAIQLTPSAVDNWGRAIYSQLLHIWEEPGKLADFNTSFSFIIDSEGKDIHSDGIVFFLTSPGFPIPRPTDGAGIGLLSRIQLNDSSFLAENKFVAVEFDTYSNSEWDPPEPVQEHVGININDMRSTNYAPWDAVITENRTYSASISYHSSTQNLSVTFTGFDNGVTPIQRHLSSIVNLTDYLPEWVEFGFSASTGLVTELHIICSWSFNSTSPFRIQTPAVPKKNGDGSKRKLVLGLSVGGCILISGMGLVWLVYRKRTKRGEEEDLSFILSMDEEFERGTGPKKFSYEELVSATNNFAEENKLGEGGFGGVYKGFINELNSYVAVKRVSRGSKQGIKEYASEVKSISQLRHRNLVQLTGWCHEKKDLLLVYEFMPNGSLDLHLFKGESLLTWVMRYNIAQGLAFALLYLHEEWEQCVLHRDIKSSNVMLDSSFNAKLGDFGLARLVDHGKGSQTTVVAGTMGYMAPECFISGRASKESDIYSFGIVLLEIACGRKPVESQRTEDEVSMVEWVWQLYGMGKLVDAADPRLCGDFDEQQLERLMIAGLWCAHPDYNLRPSIRKVVHVLSYEGSLPVLAPEMPLLTYLAAPLSASASSASTAENKHSQSASHSGSTGSSQVTSAAASSSSSALPHTHLVNTR